MKLQQLLMTAAMGVMAMSAAARTMSVTAVDSESITLGFGQPNGTNYTLCVAYGTENGGDNKYKWTSFTKNVATIAADQTSYTYTFPDHFTAGTFYRFYLLQTDNLPYVRELDYLESTSTAWGSSQGTQFIDSGIVGKSGTKMECNYTYLDGKDSTILGARAGSVRFYMSHMYWYQYWCSGYNSWNYTYGLQYTSALKGQNLHLVCELNKGQQMLMVNDVRAYSMSDSTDVDTKLNMHVFGCNWDGAPKVCIKARLFDMKIWQGNVLKRNFLPVVQENGDGALYDQVTEAIFPNGSAIRFNLGEATDEENRRGIIRAMSPVMEVLTEEEYRIPVTSYWTGKIDGDMAKDDNWRSLNRIGAEIAVAPINTTMVHFSGAVNAGWAGESATLGAAKIICDNAYLTTNCDWRVLGEVPYEGNLNLNGHKLKLAWLSGTGAITDRPLAVAGYEPLAYIESPGANCHIDSGVVGQMGTTVDIDMMGLDQAYDSCVVGSRTGGTRFLPFWSLNYRICFGYKDFKGGGVNYGSFPNDGFAHGKRYVGYNRMRDGSQNTYMNGLRACNGTIAGEYNTGYSMYIFAMNYDGNASYYNKSRIYAARFYTDNGATMVRDFVPARRTSDGALGLYDKLNQKFHASIGSKSLTAGATMTAAPGPAGELWIDVVAGHTNVNSGVSISGSAKFVKCGKGVFRTMVANQTYKGGTMIVDGIFDQGVVSTYDSMPLGQDKVTVVFEKERDTEWPEAYYYTWETRPANTMFTLSPATRSKGFILVEEAGGIFIKHPQFYIFFR